MCKLQQSAVELLSPFLSSQLIRMCKLQRDDINDKAARLTHNLYVCVSCNLRGSSEATFQLLTTYTYV